MSVVIPFPVPDPSESTEQPGSDSVADAAPALRLVAGHEHVWELRSVDYDEAIEVRRYECTGCDDVHFR